LKRSSVTQQSFTGGSEVIVMIPGKGDAGLGAALPSI